MRELEKSRKEIAMEYFKSGYNCAQSISLAFADILPLEKELLVRASGPLGAGVGRLREVCGAITGMSIVLGLLYGQEQAMDPETKEALYTRVQENALSFEKVYGTVICRDLLKLDLIHDAPTPEARTDRYYKERPCLNLVGSVAEILEDYIKKNPF